MTRPTLTVLAALLAAALSAVAALVGWRRRQRVALLDAPGPAAGVLTDDGLRLHVEEDGDPDAPVTVVFSHGFTAQLGEFVLQRETLRSRARVVLYDQRGHGRSPLGAPENATMEQLGRDLAAVIAQRVPRGPVVLVGHSMGGMTLMTFARQHPDVVRDRVVGAFLLATSAGEVVDAGVVGRGVRLLRRLHLIGVYLRWLRLVSPVLERFRARGTVAGRAFTRRYLFGKDDATDAALVREVQTMLEETPLTVTAAFYATFLAHDELASLAAMRDVPVTVLCGTHDRLTPLAHSRRIAAELPSAELVVVPGAGHSVNISRQQVVDDARLELLDRATARAGAA